MTDKQMVKREDAKSLAIAYEAFHSTDYKEDPEGKRMWARILKKAQRATGIELALRSSLDYWINGR
jgi:hypothetical protein